MYRYSLLLIMVACGMPGCDRNETGASPRQPDNTAVNERDRNHDTALPLDQSNASADLEITKSIRQAVVGLDNASINAQNIKIITVGGRVTLRGPVATAAEREAIVSIAHRIAGADRVTDELEVATPQEPPANPSGSQP